MNFYQPYFAAEQYLNGQTNAASSAHHPEPASSNPAIYLLQSHHHFHGRMDQGHPKVKPNSATESSENRKTSCSVCEEVTDNHHLHYGALCCFSCRAFFRRANQRSKGINYSCKFSGRCDVSFKNRKKCQKCRYEKCLSVGMDPGLVLTDEQKKVRFRKKIQKVTSSPTPPALSHVSARDAATPSVSAATASGGAGHYASQFPSSFSQFGYNSHPSRMFEGFPYTDNIEPSFLQPAPPLKKEIQVKQEFPEVASDFSEFNRYNDYCDLQEISSTEFSSSLSVLQDDSLAELNSTLSLAAEQAMIAKLPASSASGASQYCFYSHQPSFSNEMPSHAEKSTAINTGWSSAPKANHYHDQREQKDNDVDNVIFTMNAQMKKIARKIKMDTSMVHHFIEYHLNAHSTLGKEAIGELFSTILNQFREFSSRQSFKGVNETDLGVLQERNGCLYLAYLMSKYISSCKGRDQLSWLLGEDEELLSCCPGDLLVKPFFLESSSQSSAQWKKSLEAVDAAINAGPEHNGVIASVLLLNTLNIPAGTLSCHKAVVDAQEQLLLIIDGSFLFHFIFTHEVDDDQAEDNLEFIRHLQTLDGIIQSSKRSSTTCLALEVDEKETDTIEEKNEMVKYDTVFKDVPMGDDWVKEFVMFSYDVPLSKNFAVTSHSAFVERYKRILMAQEGFKDLSAKDQMAIWSSGGRRAAALCAARTESLSTGKEQLDFLLGQSDAQHWRNNFEESLAKSRKSNKLRKISMLDCNKVTTIFTTEEMMEYTTCVVNLGEIMHDWETFKLLTLISLFSNCSNLSADGAQFAEKMKAQYLALLKSKTRSNRVYDKVDVALKDVDKLSSILQKLDISSDSTRQS